MFDSIVFQAINFGWTFLATNTPASPPKKIIGITCLWGGILLFFSTAPASFFGGDQGFFDRFAISLGKLWRFFNRGHPKNTLNSGLGIIARWCFQIFFYVHPYLGKISNLTNIFQMGGSTTNQIVICPDKSAPHQELSLFFGWYYLSFQFGVLFGESILTASLLPQKKEWMIVFNKTLTTGDEQNDFFWILCLFNLHPDVLSMYRLQKSGLFLMQKVLIS